MDFSVFDFRTIKYGSISIILGEKFDLMDGILGLALTKYIPGRDRTLFFHSLSSVTQNRVETSILRNSSLFFDTPQAASDSFYVSH